MHHWDACFITSAAESMFTFVVLGVTGDIVGPRTSAPVQPGRGRIRAGETRRDTSLQPNFAIPYVTQSRKNRITWINFDRILML